MAEVKENYITSLQLPQCHLFRPSIFYLVSPHRRSHAIRLCLSDLDGHSAIKTFAVSTLVLVLEARMSGTRSED